MAHAAKLSKDYSAKDRHMAITRHINEKGCDGLHKIVPAGQTADAQAAMGTMVEGMKKGK